MHESIIREVHHPIVSPIIPLITKVSLQREIAIKRWKRISRNTNQDDALSATPRPRVSSQFHLRTQFTAHWQNI